MYKKICNIYDKLFTGKWICILFALLFVITLFPLGITLTSNNNWEKLSRYPEDTYQELEKEAIRMIQTENFDTDYYFNIRYNNLTDYLSFDLSYNSDTSVTATVKGYKNDIQKITLERKYPTPSKYFRSNILALICIPIAVGLFGTVLLVILASLFRFLAWLIHKVVKRR